MQVIRLQYCAQLTHFYKRASLFSTVPSQLNNVKKVSNRDSAIDTQNYKSDTCAGYVTRSSWFATDSAAKSHLTINATTHWNKDRFCNSTSRIVKVKTGDPFTNELPHIPSEFQSMTQIHPLLRSILAEKRFEHSSVIQQKAIALFDAGYDFHMESENGSGKTLAYILPLLTKISQTYPEEMMRDLLSSDGKTQYPLGLILTQSKYHNNEIKKLLIMLSHPFNLRSVAVTNFDKNDPIQEILKGCHVLATHAKSLMEYCSTGILSLKHLKYFIVDNGYQFLNPKMFNTQSQPMLSAKENRQNIFVKDIPQENDYPPQTEFLRDDALFLSVGDPVENMKNIHHKLEIFNSDEEKFTRLIQLIRSLENTGMPIVVVSAFKDEEVLISEMLKEVLVGVKVVKNSQFLSYNNSKSQVLVISSGDLMKRQVRPTCILINVGMARTSMDYCFRSSFLDPTLGSCSMYSLISPSNIEKIYYKSLKYIIALLKSIDQPNTEFFHVLELLVSADSKPNSEPSMSKYAGRNSFISEYDWKRELHDPNKKIGNNYRNDERPHAKNKHFHSTFDVSWVQDSSLELPAELADRDRVLNFSDQHSAQRINLSQLTVVQRMTSALFDTEHDFFVQSEKGSGKTLAYLFPLTSHMIQSYPREAMLKRMDPDVNKVYPSGLILASNKIAVQQISWDATRLCSHVALRPVAFNVVESSNGVSKLLKLGCDLAIGTPLQIEKSQKDGLLSLEFCKFIVVDDADDLFKFYNLETESILDSFSKNQSIANHQILIVSDFLSHQTCKFALKFMRPNPLMLSVGNVGAISKNINYDFQFLDNEDLRNSELIKLFKEHSDDTFVLVCHNYKEKSEMSELLQQNGIDCDTNCYDPRYQRHFTNSKILVVTGKEIQGINSPTAMRVVCLCIPRTLPDFVNILTPLDSSIDGRAMHLLITSKNLTNYKSKDVDQFEQIMSRMNQPNVDFFHAVNVKGEEILQQNEDNTFSSNQTYPWTDNFN